MAAAPKLLETTLETLAIDVPGLPSRTHGAPRPHPDRLSSRADPA